MSYRVAGLLLLGPPAGVIISGVEMNSPRTFLTDLYRIAVAAAHPASCLVQHLPDPPAGRIVLLAAGKAAGSMTEIAEQHYLDELRLPPARLIGTAVTRRGYARPTRIIRVAEAGHPVPDDASFAAAEQALNLAASATADDLVLVLLSGGASANWVAPAAGLTFAEKQALNRMLLKSGATIVDINAVRKHLSRIKGGRLGRLAYPARVVTLAVSDVSGDDPAVIGSGPTVPDPTTLEDARAVLARFGLNVSDAVGRALADPANETPKPRDPFFDRNAFRLIARPREAFCAAEAAIRAEGFDCIFLGDRIDGEARDVAAAQAKIAKDIQAQGRCGVIVSGGELTVTIRGKGRGGPNQEYALALAQELRATPGISAVAGDTDGTDGGDGNPDDPAGAFIDDTTLARANHLGLDPAAFLADNDSTAFFEQLGDLLQPGPTFTNVNDFRAIFVGRH
jgi:hydroxypyruvate reductase